MPILFLHGFPFDPRMWGELPAGAAAPLLYELGDTIDAWADAILERYDGPLTLVGASMGGYVAYEIARRAPERVHGLLTEGSRGQADPPGARRRRDESIEVVRSEGLEALWELRRPVTFAADADPAVLEQARGWALDRHPEEVIRALVALRDRRDTTDVLKGLDPPPWIVLGEHDAIARPADFTGIVAEESIRLVPGSGHLPNLERPQAWDALLQEFLAWATSPQTS